MFVVALASMLRSVAQAFTLFFRSWSPATAEKISRILTDFSLESTHYIKPPMTTSRSKHKLLNSFVEKNRGCRSRGQYIDTWATNLNSGAYYLIILAI